ncbi:MAG: hypothetical protein WCE53_11180 [Candidatus Acidiferrum sp.]
MTCPHKGETLQGQRGAALLIAIFALLLISVVAIALVVSAGTDSALTGNYRTSTSAYYADVAGLEEARGRLLWKNPNYINNTNNYSTLLNSSGLPTWGLTQVLYIVNPADGEAASSVLTDYPDAEYEPEFGWPLSGAIVNQITSVSRDTVPSPSLPGQAFRWVRITPATEKSLGIDVDGNSTQDSATVLYYDPAHVDGFGNFTPGLISTPTPPPTAVQALELTAFAVLPSGSRRMLQYVVAPLMVAPNAASNTFPAALTLTNNPVGNPPSVSFTVPSPNPGPPPINNFEITGQDSCAGNALVYSVGYTQSGDSTVILGAATPPSKFLGAPPGSSPPPSSPGIGNINPTPATSLLRPNWLTPLGLDEVVQDITKSADIVLNGSINANTSLTPLLAGMTPPGGNPMTIVVNGDLDFNGWHQTGYGLLLVTGTLKYDPDATWFGPILIIGQGSFVSTRSGSGQINGPVFIAKTRDTSGTLLATLGSASFSQTGSSADSGYGIHYSSCAGQSALGFSAQGPLTYKVLSFREIPLAN